MDERHIRVARTARYHALGEPGPWTSQVWLVCHGYGQLAARFLRRFGVLDDGSRYIVAPEALNRFYVRRDHQQDRTVGATWMTREDRLHEIDDYLGYLDAVCGRIFSEVDRDAVEFVALGFSQGVATMCRWAARAPVPPDRIVAWAGWLPDELEPSPRLFGDAHLTLVVGDRDHHASDGADRRMVSRLEAGAVPHDFIRFSGGHELHPTTLIELAAARRGMA